MSRSGETDETGDTYVERLVLGATEHLVRALDLALRRVVALVDLVQVRVRVVVGRSVAQLAGRWVELDADLLLGRERRREIGRLSTNRIIVSDCTEKKERTSNNINSESTIPGPLARVKAEN